MINSQIYPKKNKNTSTFFGTRVPKHNSHEFEAAKPAIHTKPISAMRASQREPISLCASRDIFFWRAPAISIHTQRIPIFPSPDCFKGFIFIEQSCLFPFSYQELFIITICLLCPEIHHDLYLYYVLR